MFQILNEPKSSYTILISSSAVIDQNARSRSTDRDEGKEPHVRRPSSFRITPNRT